MKTALTDSRSAAITSFLLALPFTSLPLLFVPAVEPRLGPLAPLLDPEAGHLGSFVGHGTT